jgi:hypothetical protein
MSNAIPTSLSVMSYTSPRERRSATSADPPAPSPQTLPAPPPPLLPLLLLLLLLQNIRLRPTMLLLMLLSWQWLLRQSPLMQRLLLAETMLLMVVQRRVQPPPSAPQEGAMERCRQDERCVCRSSRVRRAAACMAANSNGDRIFTAIHDMLVWPQLLAMVARSGAGTHTQALQGLQPIA